MHQWMHFRYDIKPKVMRLYHELYRAETTEWIQSVGFTYEASALNTHDQNGPGV